MNIKQIEDFLRSDEWDAPFFKVLAHNDTGQAVGHQAGMVLPKELRQYLPSLSESKTSSISPTIDRHIRAEMFVGTHYETDSVVRYQYQTWGGTRSAESRITDGFQPLRNQATGGDVLIFQRRADAFDRFRLVLIKQTAPEYAQVHEWTNTRKWGRLFEADEPVTETQISTADAELVSLAQNPFELVKADISRVETRQTRIARSSVFRERIRLEYGRRCAVSGIAVMTPTALYEVESAHVVPVSERGTDDIRNGLALTHTLHWAFDRGLFGIRPDRTVYIPKRVQLMAENEFLKKFNKQPLSEATTANLRVHPDALNWHFANRVAQWD